MDEKIKIWLNDPVIGKLVILFVGIAVIWSILLLIRAKLLSRIEDSSSRYHSRKAITFTGYVITIIFIIFLFSSKLNNLTVALGVAGAGIAFALQEVIASVAGWMALLFGGFYRVGDRVQLGGIKGDVIDIGVLRTTLMEIGEWVKGDLYNGRIVRIANSFVFKEPVFNYSGDFPFLWDEIKLPIQYGSDYTLAKELTLKIANEVVGHYSAQAREKWKLTVKKYMIENASTDPMISVEANDNWVEFTLRYVVDYKFRRTTKNNLFLRLLEEVEKTNGKIKFASATFQLVEAPEIKVSLKKES
jgi:small-conductance mechanosensitive channel